VEPVDLDLRPVARRVFRHLAIGTAICLALAAFSVSPYGWQLQTWLLD
jgi:hypothetical protein